MDNYDTIRAAFFKATNDPTGSSDHEFCKLMDEAFVRIFAEELAKEVEKQKQELVA